LPKSIQPSVDQILSKQQLQTSSAGLAKLVVPNICNFRISK